MHKNTINEYLDKIANVLLKIKKLKFSFKTFNEKTNIKKINNIEII